MLIVGLSRISDQLNQSLSHIVVNMRIKSFFLRSYIDNLEDKKVNREAKEICVNKTLDILQYFRNDFIKELVILYGKWNPNIQTNDFHSKIVEMERFFSAHAREFINSTASDEEMNKYLNYRGFVHDLSSAIDEIAYYTDSDNQYRFTINALYPRSKIKRIIEDLLKIN